MPHTSTEQPEALRLAEHLEKFRSFPDDLTAAAELRRLHSRVQELEAAQERVPLSDGRLVEAIESFTGFISGDVDKFVAHIESAHGITQEKRG